MVGLSRSTLYSLAEGRDIPEKHPRQPVCCPVQDRGDSRVDEIAGKAKDRNKAGVLTERQQQRLMAACAEASPKAPPKAVPYYTMGDVMRLAGRHTHKSTMG